MTRTVARLGLLGLAASIALAAPARADVLYTAGHGDIGVAYNDAEGFHLHWHFDNTSNLINGTPGKFEYEPDEVVALVGLDSERVSAVSRPFLGLDAGDSFFMLSAFQEPNLPYLGISSDELPFSAAGNPEGLRGSLSQVRWELDSLTGPGEFALWRLTGSLTEQALWSSIPGQAPNFFLQNPGAHGHFFWGFTAPGLYEVGIRVSVTQTLNGVDTFFQATDVFRFEVVPEPASVASLAIGAVGIGLVALRRRKARRA